MGDRKRNGLSEPQSAWLTKSQFIQALDCPTKLFYIDGKYASDRDDDAFLTALTEGGFQVGALAKTQFPDGVEVDERDPAKAIDITRRLLQAKDITLFEAALAWEKLLIRVDVLQKVGNVLHLYEVKAKSYRSGDSFTTSKWKPYLYDIAFQTHVARQVFPTSQIHPHLILPDKSKVCSVDGLHQKFLISRQGKRVVVTSRSPLTASTLGTPILTTVGVDEEVAAITRLHSYAARPGFKEGSLSFAALVTELSNAQQNNRKLPAYLGTHCRDCEFNSESGPNGFKECWAEPLRKRPEGTPAFKVWSWPKANKLIAEGAFFIEDLHEEDIAPEEDPEQEGMTASERRWLQVRKVQEGDPTRKVRVDGLRARMGQVKYPLHFIDFETFRPAIPFHKGLRPYQQLAFQFSHHQVSASGEVVHQGEYLCREAGKFPNFEFIRELKSQLEKDAGSILIYANHENTVLNDIAAQLADSQEKDRESLIAWIQTIAKPPADSNQQAPLRQCVDLCDLYKRFIYLPATQGSNSLKRVLPATLNEVAGKPVDNPYDTLPPLFDGHTDETLHTLLPHSRIADGGAAMMAYAKMQFTEMTEVEAKEIQAKLLAYCKLDTLAMVWIWQAWRRWTA